MVLDLLYTSKGTIVLHSCILLVIVCVCGSTGCVVCFLGFTDILIEFCPMPLRLCYELHVADWCEWLTSRQEDHEFENRKLLGELAAGLQGSAAAVAAEEDQPLSPWDTPPRFLASRGEDDSL